jgi:hypothetical protein
MATGAAPMVVDDSSQAARQLVQRPPPSQNGQQLSQNFSTKGDDVLDVVQWQRSTDMEKLAMECIDLHQCSLTLDQMALGEEELDIGEKISVTCSDGNHHTRTVKHLGQGVYVQNNTLGVDIDSTKNSTTITTIEMRKFAIMSLGPLLLEKGLVVGTGQPRIGKTRGIMAYTLQELLWRGEAVMRVGYKDSISYLFLPQSDRSYKVWEANAQGWNQSRLVKKSTMFVLLDPPESPNYERAARCLRIEYCSNNEERHTKNVYKDGALRITNMPCLDEILCMATVLWDDKVSPINMRAPTGENILVQRFHSNEEREQELYRRCTLVGCIPGVVFSGDLFIEVLTEIKANSAQECSKSGLGHMIHFYKEGKVGANKGLVSAMSRFFHVNAADYERRVASVRLNQAASFYVQRQLREKLSELTGSNAFDFEDVCAMLLKGGTWGNRNLQSRTIVCGKNWHRTSQLILSLRSGNKKLVRASNCYPLLDFATEPYEWFNAKVGERDPKISLSAFVTLMRYLGCADIVGGKLKVKNGLPKISLVLIRNVSASQFTFDKKMARSYETMDCNQVQRVFEETVEVTFLNTSDWSREQAFDARISAIEEMLDNYSIALNHH